jgi:SAM-dependent methyltransferase
MSYLVRLFHNTEEENRRVILGLLERRADARLLDLGCYDGDWTLRLAERVGTKCVHGVEISPSMVDHCRARGIEVTVGNLNERVPLPDASFDVIHANQVIEHLHDTDMFVQEVHRLLAPGGYAILSTNNLASLHNIVSLVLAQQPPPAHVSNRVLLGNGINPLHGQPHDSPAMAHLRLFAYRALREFLAHYGLRCEVYRTVGFYPFPVTMSRLMTKVLPWYGAFLTCKARRKD